MSFAYGCRRLYRLRAMQKHLQTDADPVDFTHFVSFKGTLEIADRSWPISFRAKINRAGEVVISITPLTLNKNTLEIKSIWRSNRKTVQYFTLSGKARGRAEFHSNTFFLSGISLQNSEKGSFLTLKGGCSTSRLIHASLTDRVFVYQALRGFECFRSHHTTCPFGDISMGGVTPLPSDNAISGFLSIKPKTLPDDLDRWREEVSKLFHHVRLVMSFAGSRQIKCPITQFGNESTIEIKTSSQTHSDGSGMAPFSRLSLGAIFNTAVASYFSNNIAVKKISFAIEWLTMGSSHTEVRLINAMTALEYLTDANLPKKDSLFLPKKRFSTLAKIMRDSLPPPEDEFEEHFHQAVRNKLQEVNRVALREKIERLARRWNVNISDLPADGLSNAINARNAIVHRGHYYEDGPIPPESRDLWDHVRLVREIITRLLFAALDYHGKYFSHLNGPHDAVFPPLSSEPTEST